MIKKSTINSSIIQAFLFEVLGNYNVKIVPKEDSKFMKILGFIVKPFNPLFQKYITTIGKTIYASKEFLSEPYVKVLEVICHEGMHVVDRKRYNLLYEILYLFPQVPLTLLGLILSLVLWNGWLLIPTLLMLAPIPAYFRYLFELRAYRTQIMFQRLVYKGDINITIESIVEQLAGKWYYFCFPFKSQIRKDLQKVDCFNQEKYYIDIVNFLTKYQLIQK